MNAPNKLDGPLDLRSFITYRLSRLQSLINSQAQHILRTYGDVGHSEWRVLILVEDRGTSTMAHVVRDGQIDKAQVSRAVKTLVEKGYLDSRTDPADHRQSLLSLTDAGRAVHDRIRPHMQARQRHLLRDLSEEDVTRLYQMLDHLEKAAERRDF